MKAWLLGMSFVGALAIGLPASAQDHFTGDLCGNKVDATMKAPTADADAELMKFYGVWGKGQWSSGICNGLMVSEVTGNKATITYYYGPGPGVPTSGSFVKTDATMKGKYLSFKSEKGIDVTYELAGNQLTGWFGGTKLSKPLEKTQ